MNKDLSNKECAILEKILDEREKELKDESSNKKYVKKEVIENMKLKLHSKRLEEK